MTTRALAYLRVSTTGQVENTSLQVQRTQTEAEIARRGWELTEVVTDAGISGTRDDRPGWQQVINMCRNGEADAVVVASFTRFARSVQSIVAVTDQLTEMGITFVSIKENLDMSTAAGRMMRSMLAAVAEFELEQIRERTMDGRRAAIRDRSGWPGGPPPLGWRLGDEGPEPDPRERQALQIVYQGYAVDGVSSGVIAQRLNDSGIRPRRAAEWSHAVVRRTAINEVYWTGMMRYGAAPGTDRISGRVRNTKVGKDGQPLYGETLAVVLPEPPWSQQQYEAVVVAVQDRKKRSNQTQRRTAAHPLSGHLVMPCGQGAYGVDLTRSTKAGSLTRAYRCKGKRHAPKCRCSQIRAEVLETEVAKRLAAVVFDPEKINRTLRDWVKQMEEPAQDHQEELKARQREYQAAVVKLDRAIDVATETGSERARQRIPALQAAADECANALAQAQQQQALATAGETQFDVWKRSFVAANVPPAEDPETTVAEILAQWVEKYQIEVQVVSTQAKGLVDFEIHGTLVPGGDPTVLYATGPPSAG